MLNNVRRLTIFSRLRYWIVTHKRTSYALLAGGIILIGATVSAVLMYPKPQVDTGTNVVKVQPKPEPIQYYSPLTGEKIENKEAQTALATAIMIENSPDARPQSGLKDAGVIYEAIAEGGITRFLAIYQNKNTALIGPVRSLRMYYVDWLAPYNASVAHVGGSQNALQEIRNGNYRDIDQFFNDGAYWRASDRYAPHNVYTSFKDLHALSEAKGYTESIFTSFPRVDGAPAEVPDANTIAINFSSASYNTSYVYDKEHNVYKRSLAGVPHIDREAGELTPSVVVVLRVVMQHVMEDGYREQITTTGTGTAVLFQNGIAQEVIWHKADRASPLILTDSEGRDVPLIRGQTWIAAVPTANGGSVSWQP